MVSRNKAATIKMGYVILKYNTKGQICKMRIYVPYKTSRLVIKLDDHSYSLGQERKVDKPVRKIEYANTVHCTNLKMHHPEYFNLYRNSKNMQKTMGTFCRHATFQVNYINPLAVLKTTSKLNRKNDLLNLKAV